MQQLGNSPSQSDRTVSKDARKASLSSLLKLEISRELCIILKLHEQLLPYALILFHHGINLQQK